MAAKTAQWRPLRATGVVTHRVRAARSSGSTTTAARIKSPSLTAPGGPVGEPHTVGS